MASVKKRGAVLDTGFHDRWLGDQLNDPAFRATFERERREIEIIDSIVNTLERLREDLGISKAELARAIDKNPASIRRLLTVPGNPELRTIVAVADALDAEVKIVPRRGPTTNRGRKRAGAA